MNVRPVMRWGLMLPTQLSEFNVRNWREQVGFMLCVRGLSLYTCINDLPYDSYITPGPVITATLHIY